VNFQQIGEFHIRYPVIKGKTVVVARVFLILILDQFPVGYDDADDPIHSGVTVAAPYLLRDQLCLVENNAVFQFRRDRKLYFDVDDFFAFSFKFYVYDPQLVAGVFPQQMGIDYLNLVVIVRRQVKRRLEETIFAG
jgi:hypothetical protein